MLKWSLLLYVGLVLGSCHQKKKQLEQAATPQTATTSTPRLIYRPTGPDPAVYDLLPVRGDTLIAVKWHGGLALTTDAGKQWKGLHDQRNKPDFLSIKYLTIDQHHVLWGLDSWPGIHEPAYSRLAYSTDFGQTWTRQEFDTHTFFPYAFYSRPGQALQVVTYDGKVYQMQDRVGKKWKVLQAIAELDNSVNDTLYGDSYFANARFKFLETGQLFSKVSAKWKPLVTIDFITEVHDVCSCSGSTYVVGYKGGSSPTPHYLVRITGGQVRDTITLADEDQNYLRCDAQGRLWLFNFRGIWEKSGKKLLKRY
jgi:hypothetical protein